MAFVARSRSPRRSVSYPKIIIEVSCLRKEMSKKIARSNAPLLRPTLAAPRRRAARRNSPTSLTGAQLHSRTQCDEFHWASANGSANHKRATREAGRPPIARFALALCAQTVQLSPLWARRPWIFDGTGDTLAPAVRRRHTRRGAGCAAPLDASSKRRVGVIAGQRQCPRTATNRCAALKRPLGCRLADTAGSQRAHAGSAKSRVSLCFR